MNCEEANQTEIVYILNALGFQPQKISRSDHWYYSPFRDEKEPSFKVERNKNVWYDHGLGKGGKLVDFAMEYFRCNVSEALQKISSFHRQKIPIRPPFHPKENNLFNEVGSGEKAIKIIVASQPIKDPSLCRYLEQRKINKNIADKYCHEVQFTNGNQEKIYRAIGFKNNAGGYELRNEYFKGGSSPKYVTYLDNEANKLSVFEGFFDFMSYQSLEQNKEHELTNFLILNSISFFERSLLLMEKHQSIHLYLDRDNAGRKCTNLALQRSLYFKDESKLFKGYKDLNDWMMSLAKIEKQKKERNSRNKHL